MSTKPPKGIQEKIVVDAIDAEVLWHLLSELPDVNINGLEHWDTLAFGLLGGVDVGQQSNLLRDRPVRVQVQTHRASFQRFCQTLQLGFEEYNLHNQWTVDEVDDLLDMTDNVFYINKKGVWKLCVDDESDTAVWWAENRVGKVWHREKFSPKRGEKIWLVEDVSTRSMQEIIHLVLSEQCAHFINSTGVESQVQNWLHHIRRPSLRKSWANILTESIDYYWAGVQLYHEIHSGEDVAFRERYIQFLLSCAEYLHCPDLKSMALDFRKSQRYWTQLSTVLLEETSQMLKQIPELDWTNTQYIFESASLFEKEEFQENLDARLVLMEESIVRIVNSERRFFIVVSEVLAGLARGKAVVEKMAK